MNDQELAALLGETPATPDPMFRIETFARVAAKARRREAHFRAARIVGVSTAIGLFFPLAEAAGFTVEAAQPLIYAAAAVGLSYFLVREAMKGPRSALARSFSALRFR